MEDFVKFLWLSWKTRTLTNPSDRKPLKMSKNNYLYFNMKLCLDFKELTIEFVQVYNFVEDSGQEIKKRELKESVFDFEQARGHYKRKKTRKN